MNYLISLFLFLISFVEIFSYQIEWRKTLEENNGYYFSRNGEEIIIKKSLGFEILDRMYGNGSTEQPNGGLAIPDAGAEPGAEQFVPPGGEPVQGDEGDAGYGVPAEYGGGEYVE